MRAVAAKKEMPRKGAVFTSLFLFAIVILVYSKIENAPELATDLERTAYLISSFVHAGIWGALLAFFAATAVEEIAQRIKHTLAQSED